MEVLVAMFAFLDNGILNLSEFPFSLALLRVFVVNIGFIRSFGV
jgi:hypothetical protein